MPCYAQDAVIHVGVTVASHAHGRESTFDEHSVFIPPTPATNARLVFGVWDIYWIGASSPHLSVDSV